MLSLVFRNAGSIETHYIKNIYDLDISSIAQGGPLGLVAIVPINLIKPVVDVLYDISLYDGFDEIWLGRVKDVPRLTVNRQAAVIVCEGYFKHLSDDRYKPSYTMPKTADAIIKDVLTNACPKISTDQSKINAGTYSIQKFDVTFSTTPQTLIERANAFEGYDWGFWDRGSDGKVRMTFKAHDRGAIDYFVSLKNCRPSLAGKSIEELYNKAYVAYGDFSEVTRTATNTTLSSAGITRAVSLSEISLNQSDASQVGDAYLAQKAKPQGKGTVVVQGTVRDAQGRKIEAYRIRPGKNILIYDLEAAPADLATITSSDVLNGKNCFAISQVDAKVAMRSAQLQLEMPADRLDILLARLGA